MYVSRNLYDKGCAFIDMDDRSFFLAALDEARKRYPAISTSGRSTAYLKSHCPIVHISSLAGRQKKKDGQEDVVDRIYVHDLSRAKRKFLMGDVDYNPGEEISAGKLVLAIRRFSREHSTPYMIYPTLSYPDKPRFRFVFLVKNPLNASQHWKAMKLLYEELGAEVTDDSDLRINVNRNLPLFNRAEQISFIQTNFDDPELAPFKPNEVWGERWTSLKAPKSASGRTDFKPTDPARHAVKLDPSLAVEAARRMSKTAMARSYATFWPVVSSMAASYVCGGIDEDCAYAMLDAFAEAGGDSGKEASWTSGNRSLFSDTVRRIRDDSDLARVRPLCEWREFVGAVSVQRSDDTGRAAPVGTDGIAI